MMGILSFWMKNNYSIRIYTLLKITYSKRKW